MDMLMEAHEQRLGSRELLPSGSLNGTGVAFIVWPLVHTGYIA